MSTFDTIGFFVFGNSEDGSISAKVQEEQHQEKYTEMMYMHQLYNGIIQKQQYTLRGSKLSCSYGTDYSLLDTVQDHGIYKGNLPVLTTIDCSKSNICDFGSCLCPESNYAGRLPMTVGSKNGKSAKKASYNNFAHICVPVVPEGSVWQQVDHSIMAKTCAKGYLPLLLDSAALVCQYGGIMKIVEVSQAGTTQGSGDYKPNGNNISEEVLALMKKKYEDNDNVRKMYNKDGLCVFAFEGLGNNGGKGNSNLFPNGRYGAMMVVAIGDTVEFVTKQASTLPAVLRTKSEGTAISEDGVYAIKARRHQELYAAFQCSTEKGADPNIRVTRTKMKADGRKEGTAIGVNIHTAPKEVGDLYSTACHTICSEDYIPFLIATGCVSGDDPMAFHLQKIHDITSSIKFRGEDAYPTGNVTAPVYIDKNGKNYTRDKYGIHQFSDLSQFALDTCVAKRKKIAVDREIPITDAERDYYWYMELLCGMNMNVDVTGYYVVDRSHMPETQIKNFFLDKIDK